MGETPGPDAAVLLAGDGLVQLERVAPEGLAAEGVVAEGLLALFEHCLRVAGALGIEAFLGGIGSRSDQSTKQTSTANRGEDHRSRFHMTSLRCGI